MNIKYLLLKHFGNVNKYNRFIFSEGTDQPIQIVSSEAQSFFDDQTRPEKAYDDDLNTIYAPKDFSKANWVKFNLGKVHSVTKIVVINMINTIDS